MADLDYTIPIIDLARLGEDVNLIPIDRSDARYDEPLVNLRGSAIACSSYYARSDGDNPPFHRAIAGSPTDIWVRRSIAAKLVRVADRVRAHGCELLVLTGYTPPACLRGLWDFHLADARRRLPGDEADWRAYAKTRVRDPELFDPEDSHTWPAHTTGAAVDLTLRDPVSGRLLDMLEMGSHFEEIVEVSNSDYFERQLAAGAIASDDPRLRNRRLLHWAMTSEGFVNEPPLYWHFDWGNQLYVKTLRATGSNAPAAAWYGFAGVV